MTILGDAHGKWSKLQYILKSTQDDILQLGDLGLGFAGYVDPLQQAFPNNFYFFDGNHDNLKVCKTYSNYIGEFGMFRNMFFVRGAYSIDQRQRTVGIDWWDTEELTMQQLQECIDLYDRTKPEIVVTHDCPRICYKDVGVFNSTSSRTSDALDMMFKLHKPKLWIFGHHHKSVRFTKDTTQFICLNELETLKL